ncbi:MAG: MTH1187 family thiamine-binding protein [Bacteroidota bacterium]
MPRNKVIKKEFNLSLCFVSLLFLNNGGKKMSVLLEFAMFPTDKGPSVSSHVSKVIAMIRENCANFRLTAMGTIIETNTLDEALEIVKKAYDILGKESDRVYSNIKLDIRKGKENRLEGKIQSVEEKIGKVNR